MYIYIYMCVCIYAYTLYLFRNFSGALSLARSFLHSFSHALSLALAHSLSLIRLMAKAGNARGGGGGEKGNAVGSGGREGSERDCVDAGNIEEGGSLFEEESLFGKLTGPLPQ